MKPTLTLPRKVSRVVNYTISQEINPKQWVHVAGTPYFVFGDKQQFTDLVLGGKQQFTDLSWPEAMKKTLRETPFRVTPPSVFMPHYVQVCASVRKRKPIILYDGAGEALQRSARDDLYERRTTDTQIWLDACFEERDGKLCLATDHHMIDDNLVRKTQEPLEKMVQGDGVLADLQFNHQGFPVKKSQRQVYERGKNLVVYQPVLLAAVSFVSNSVKFASLRCRKDPQDTGYALGVLFYTEGVEKK